MSETVNPGQATRAPESVTARMYRGLLGDCFLLTHRYGDEVFTALIDCGVLQCIGASKPRTKEGATQMKAVVADLADHLMRDDGAGRRVPTLDLVVATHEHYDHLSGFLQQFEVFKTFAIRSVWLAWTENLQDEDAKAIWANGRKALSALKQAAETKDFALTPDDLDRQQAIEALLQFYGEIDTVADERFAADKGEPPPPRVPPRSCYDVIQWLKTKPDDDLAKDAGVPPEERVRYLEPGQVVAFGVRKRLTAKVLGPPRTGNRLRQLNPSAKDAKEVYFAHSDEVEALVSTLRFQGKRLAAAGRQEAAAAGWAEPRWTDYPFSSRFHRPGESSGPIVDLYRSNPARGIDGEWLGSAEALALKIDGDVNNTSLALAIELPESRHVMLFPADAQVGNWLSWHDQPYPRSHDAKPEDPKETAQDLLGRVILYKVGHHGSHNATAKALGLEMMTSPHLVAMIPVVEAVAGEQTSKSNPDGWAMPYAELNTRLRQRTRERILRGDGDPAAERAAFEAVRSLFDLTYDRATPPLWVEVRHGDPPG